MPNSMLNSYPVRRMFNALVFQFFYQFFYLFFCLFFAIQFSACGEKLNSYSEKKACYEKRLSQSQERAKKGDPYAQLNLTPEGQDRLARDCQMNDAERNQLFNPPDANALRRAEEEERRNRVVAFLGAKIPDDGACRIRFANSRWGAQAGYYLLRGKSPAAQRAFPYLHQAIQYRAQLLANQRCAAGSDVCTLRFEPGNSSISENCSANKTSPDDRASYPVSIAHSESPDRSNGHETAPEFENDLSECPLPNLKWLATRVSALELAQVCQFRKGSCAIAVEPPSQAQPSERYWAQFRGHNFHAASVETRSEAQEILNSLADAGLCDPTQPAI